MFPAEIFDRIFSFLQKDRAALSSCSAAHTFLSSIAERYLFIHLIIYIGNNTSAANGFFVAQLARCLSERPYLADHVRTITIDNHLYSRNSSEAFEELSTLLPLIPRSEKVWLRNLRWLILPENFRSALLNFLRTPSTKEVYLRNSTDFPLSTLDDARNIKTLKLDSSVCSYDTLDGTPNTTPSSLQSLFLVDVDMPDFMPWAAPRVDRLVYLHAKTSLFPILDLTPIFYVCSGSLRSLTLETGSTFRTAYTDTVTNPENGFLFNLSALAHLEVVTIHAIITGRRYPIGGKGQTISYTRWCHSSLPAVTDLVRTAGPSLTRLVLNLNCNIYEAPDLCDALEWEPLILLCDSHPHLQVDLGIRAVFSHVQLPIVEVVDSLCGNEDLSRLVKQGSIAIKPLVPPDF